MSHRPAAIARIWSYLTESVSRVRTELDARRRQRESRQALLALSDRELRDIGLTREQIQGPTLPSSQIGPYRWL